jgi:hypothetical protein
MFQMRSYGELLAAEELAFVRLDHLELAVFPGTRRINRFQAGICVDQVEGQRADGLNSGSSGRRKIISYQQFMLSS